MTLVAEGVEDESTAAQLALSGCDESQGFYFSEALPAAQLEAWLDGQTMPVTVESAGELSA
jgi:EAL domain-containing protein (putative c-di-GMP-specific phosphodiesterase class I)